MLNFTRNNTRIFLACVLLIALVLRIWGINFSPLYHPDEKMKIDRALDLIKPQGIDLNPRYFQAPNSLLYSFFVLYAGYYGFGKLLRYFNSVNDFKVFYEKNPLHFFILARLFVVILSLFTVWLVFLIGKILFDESTGVIAALFIAIIPLHAVFSHYAKEDIPLVFWMALSFLFSVLMVKRKNLSDYVFSGLFAGIAVSTKWIGLNCLWFILAAHLMCTVWYRGTKDVAGFFARHRAFMVALFFMLSGFLICSPYILIERKIFMKDMHLVFNHAFCGRYGVGPFDPLLQYPRYFLWMTWTFTFHWGMGILVSSACLIGVVYAIKKHTKSDILLLSFLVPFSLEIWNNYNSCDRYYLPAVPFLLILGARYTVCIYKWLSRRVAFSLKNSFFIVFFAVLLIEPLSDTARHDFYMLSDTRTIAAQWISQHIPRGSVIAAEGVGKRAYMPPLDDREYRVIRVDFLSGYPMSYYYQNNIEYLITSSKCYRRYSKEITPERYFFYRSIFEKEQLIKEFKPAFREYGFHNPTITIFKLIPLAKWLSYENNGKKSGEGQDD